MENTVIIFGAGASHDSLQQYARAKEPECRPPLAQDLFRGNDHLIEKFPRIGAIIGDLRRIGDGVSLEEFLFDQIYQLSASRELRALQLLDIRYFLRKLFFESSTKFLSGGTGSAYAQLLQRLDDVVNLRNGAPITFVSFNYDTLLEQAIMGMIGYKFDKIDSYINREIRYIKLHGSINWVVRLDVYNNPKPGLPDPRKDPSSHLIGLLKTFDFSLEHGKIIIDWADPDTEQSVFNAPVIGIPVRKKSFFLPPNHLQVATDALEKADKIVIVGWRGMDDHFLELLQKHAIKHPEVYVVGKKNAEQTAMLIGGRIQARSVSSSTDGFSSFLDKADSSVIRGSFF